jgi:abhydrolase domain-containing protein 12
VPTAFKTNNVGIKTPGAWLTFSDSFYAAHRVYLLAPSNFSSSPSSSEELIHTALRTHPTTLFLHGNGGTRLLRIQHYQLNLRVLSATLHANVFAPDYLGYADSMGTPSGTGLILDARASWDWLRPHGIAPENVLVGNSLCTAVAGVARKRPSSRTTIGRALKSMGRRWCQWPREAAWSRTARTV